MYIHEHFKINNKNHLEIGGCDTVELAKEYGTPLYAMDEGRIRENMRAYKNAIEKYYGGNGLALYASKALSAVALYKIAKEEEIGVDVVSGGELYTALKADFDPSKIYFHGNNKTYDEIDFAVKSKVGTFVVDSKTELDMLCEASKRYGYTINIMFRIKPGVEAHTHEFISTGQIDSKFGFAIENGEAEEIINYAKDLDGVKIIGLHCHIGSQIFDTEPFVLGAEVMMNFYAKVKNEFGIELEVLDLGGGFGISYVKSDNPLPFGEYIKSASEAIKRVCNEKGLKQPFILMEPGRSIVGDAGITLYTIGSVKDIPNVRKYVSVDGGMGDNPRYILYDAEYDGVFANRATDEPEEIVTVCGKCCESGDIIIKEASLPKAETGDILAVMSTGAYNYSMSSNYNRIPRPPIVLAQDGKARLIVKRESYEDIIRNDII